MPSHDQGMSTLVASRVDIVLKYNSKSEQIAFSCQTRLWELFLNRKSSNKHDTMKVKRMDKIKLCKKKKFCHFFTHV